jgi:hypothetical protein
MKKISDFVLVSGTHEEISKRIMDHVRMGYMLHGTIKMDNYMFFGDAYGANMYTGAKIWCIQPMVRYEEDEELEKEP